MIIQKTALTLESTRASVYLDEPDTCPQCKYAIKPTLLSCHIYEDSQNKEHIAAVYFCKHCYQPFISHSIVTGKNNSGYRLTRQLFIEPNRFVQKSFDSHISDVSPDFVNIYNQALAAETSGLDQIAGIGYRKALEFLIKDYLISKNPDDADEKAKIEKMELGNCIANKVANENLKAVASRSTWLGNDQTHYVQRFAEYDISDMKKFIDAVVYWISMEMITAEALAIDPRGH